MGHLSGQRSFFICSNNNLMLHASTLNGPIQRCKIYFNRIMCHLLSKCPLLAVSPVVSSENIVMQWRVAGQMRYEF